MVARARRMMNGFVLPLVLGSLLLSAAVVLAADSNNDWSNPPGQQILEKGCKQQFGAPSNNQTGCCTYAPGTCWKVSAIGDPQVTSWASGFSATNFKIENDNSGWRKWGNCDTPGPGVNSPCNQFPKFTCAKMDFYTGNAGMCTNFVGYVMVAVGPDCCGP